jgi:hypothetical protein
MQRNTTSSALCLLLFVSSLALLPESGHAKDASFSADAAFTEVNNCVSTELFVFIKSGSLKSFLDKGNVVAKGKLVLRLTQIDNCKGAILTQVVGKQQLKSGDLQFDGDLTSADLDTSLQLLDDANQKKKLDVELRITWTGFDDVVKSTRGEEIDEPGAFLKIKGRPAEQSLRLADAVGSLSSGGKNLVSGDAEEATISILSKP